MGKMFDKISSDAFQSIQTNTGVILNNFNPANPTNPEDKDIVCATSSDGVQASCVYTYSDFGEDIANVENNTKELKQVESVECKLSFDMLTMTPKSVALAIGPADIADSKITPRAELKLTDFQDKIWWVGHIGENKIAAICLKNVLSNGGFNLQTAKKGKGKITVELLGHFSISAPDEVPMEFYIVDKPVG